MDFKYKRSTQINSNSTPDLHFVYVDQQTGTEEGKLTDQDCCEFSSSFSNCTSLQNKQHLFTTRLQTLFKA